MNRFRIVLFLLLLFFLPTQLGKHFWPSFAFINGIRVDYLSPTFYITDILAVVFIFSCLPKIKFPKIVLPLLLFPAIGIFFSVSPLAGWYQFLKLVEFLFLGLSVVYGLHFPSIKTAAGLFVGISVLYETIIAFFQFVFQGSLGGPFYFLGERTFSSATPGIANASINGQLLLRPYGTLPHPNVLAGFLLISMLLCVGFLWGIKKRTLQVFLGVVLVVGTIGVLLSLSRIAILVLVIVYMFFLVSFFKKYKKIVLSLGTLVLIVGILIAILFPFFWERFIFSFSDESVVQRQQLLLQSWKMIRTYPLFGVGFGNFSTNVAQNARFSALILFLQPVHNIFLLLGAEGGLFFLSGVLWFVFQTIRKLFLRFSTNKVLVCCLLLSIGAIIIIGQVDHYFVTLQQGELLTTIVLGLAWNMIANKPIIQ